MSIVFLVVLVVMIVATKAALVIEENRSSASISYRNLQQIDGHRGQSVDHLHTSLHLSD